MKTKILFKWNWGKIIATMLLFNLINIGLFAGEILIEPEDIANGDQFGYSMALSSAKDYMIVGAACRYAVIYRYENGSWVQEAKLTPSTTVTGNTFASSVAIEGDLAVVGDGRFAVTPNNYGCAYIYRKVDGTWIEEQIINPTVDSIRFGITATIKNGEVFIGSLDGTTNAGAVFVFKKEGSTWVQKQKIVGNDTDADDSFGAMYYGGDLYVNDNGELFIPAYSRSESTGTGAVYCFTKNSSGTWVQNAKILPSSTTSNFGYSIAAAGTRLLVGAPMYNSCKGEIFVFDKNSSGTWEQTARLAASAGNINDYLGNKVVIKDENTIFAAAVCDDTKATDSGAVYMWKYNGSAWVENKIVFNTVGIANDLWGRGLLVGNNKLMVSCPAYDKPTPANYTNSGAVLVKDLDDIGKKTLYNFDDETAGACDGTATDSGYTTPNNATISNYTGATFDYIGGYDGRGLTFGTSVSADSKMTTTSAITWGSKFVLEARIWKGAEVTGAIDLIKTGDGTTDNLKWYVSSDGKIHLEMNDGNGHTANVVTTNSVISTGRWTTICAVVDLTKSTYSEAIKFYLDMSETNNNVCNSSYAFAQSYYSASYVPGYAFDGNVNTAWLSPYTANMIGVLYIGQNFGEQNNRHIREVTIQQVVGNIYAVSSFKVQKSTDNSTWTTVATISTPVDNGIYTYDVPVSEGARYWRLLANAQAADSWWMIKEIQMKELVQHPTLSSTYTYTLANCTLPSTNVVDMLQRITQDSNTFTLKCDYVKISGDASFTTYDTSNFYVTSTSNYVKPGSSSAVIVDPSALIRRVTNPASDFTAGAPKTGVTVAYDNHPTTPSVFHGIFELNFQLDKASFDGTVTVDIYIQKPEDSTFKKIGQITTTEPVAEEDPWNVKYYWDSRTANYDWSTSDAGAYRTDGLVKFKFQVR